MTSRTSPRHRRLWLPAHDEIQDRPAWAVELTIARIAAGLTQSELAAAVGVDRSVVTRWELGVNHPRPARMARVRRVLGLEAGAQGSER